MHMQSTKKNGLAINDVEASIVLITDSFKGIEQPHQIIAYRSARGFHVSVIGAHVDFGVSSSVEAYSVPYGTMLRASDYQIPIEHISYLTDPDSKGMLAGTVSSKVVKAKADLYKCESMAALGEDKDIRALYNDNYFFDEEHKGYVRDVLKRACVLGIIDSFNDTVCRSKDVAARVRNAGLTSCLNQSLYGDKAENIVANIKRAQEINQSLHEPISY